MRIIGGKDYYDGAVPFDTDETRCFVRHEHSKSTSVDVPVFNQYKKTLMVTRALYGRQWAEGYYCMTILFCGMVHNFVMKNARTEKYNIKTKSFSIEKFFWTKKDLLQELEADSLRIASKSPWDSDNSDKHLIRENLDDFFEKRPVSKEVMDYLIENSIIVAISRSVNDKWNPQQNAKWYLNTDTLKEYHFGSQVDPYTANQEIDVFLGTILVADEDRQVKLSDASKIKKHGFDKWSFRNQKHRGKPRSRVS